MKAQNLYRFILSKYNNKEKSSGFWWQPYQIYWPYAVSQSLMQNLGQKSKMEHLLAIVNGWKPLTICTKGSVLDVWLGSECVSEVVITYRFLRIS